LEFSTTEDVGPTRPSGGSREERPVTADHKELTADEGRDDPLAVAREALRATERERLRALREADMAVAERLHADDYQLIPPTGATWSKREYLDVIASHRLTYQVFEPISSIAVRVSDQMAAVRYRAQFEVSGPSGATDSGTFWHTDIYEKRDGHWQVVWSQATRIPPED
jgi:hypothetical protein